MGKRLIAYVNGKMLKKARKRSPIKIEEISNYDKKLNSTDVEKWENEEEYPSINEAKRLAKIYDVPFAAFYLDVWPEDENKKYIDRRTYKDNTDIEETYTLWKQINELNNYRENIIELIDKKIMRTI